VSSHAEAVTEAALAAATGECAVLLRQTAAVNARWAGNSLTTNGIGSSDELTVVAFADVAGGRAAASVTRSTVAPGEVAALVAEAEAAARDSGPADDAADLPRGAVRAGFAEPAAEVTAADLVGFAGALGDVFGQAQAAGIELFGYAEHAVSTTWLATSTGTRVRHAQPATRVEMTGKSHGRTRSTWSGRSGRSFAEIDAHALYRDVVTRLGWQGRTVRVEPGRRRTLLSPGAVADLLIYLLWSADGRAAAEGRSAFSAHPSGTRLGETIAARPLRLWSDPHHPGLQCADVTAVGASGGGGSVFDNGEPIGATDWIHDGRIAGLWQNRGSAARTGMLPTPAADNLLLAERGAAGDLDDLIARSDDGLLVTCLWYIREVDPTSLLLTGLTRDGVYRISGGEVVGAVGNFRFNESPLAMLGRIADVGATGITMPREWADWFTRTAMPAVAVDGFNMSTASQAS
jgi:predicted Zn-dependent protease